MNSEQTPIEKASAELRAAVGSMPAMAPRSGSRHPALIFAGAALAVTLIIGVPVVLSGPGPDIEGAIPASAPTSTSTTASASTTTPPAETTTTGVSAATCGTALPFTISLPADFAGRVQGPSPHSPDPLESGQTAYHWSGRGGSVEFRWPANETYIEGALWGAEPSSGRSDGTGFVYVQDTTIDGVEYPDLPQVADRLPTSVMSGPCDAVQLRVYGPDGDQTENSLFGVEDPDRPNTLVIYPDIPRPRDLMLIVESLSVENVPEVYPCMGGSEAAGFEVPPIESETIADPVPFPTPVEALEALVADTEGWPKTGYFELHEPDGSITYGNPLDDLSPEPRPENGLVISISVTQEDDGWAVDSWSSSGC